VIKKSACIGIKTFFSGRTRFAEKDRGWTAEVNVGRPAPFPVEKAKDLVRGFAVTEGDGFFSLETEFEYVL
jgi:hypothetical protein